MFFNKNGLKLNLNFDYSINEKDIGNLEKNKIKKSLIRKEINLFFSPKTEIINSINNNNKKENSILEKNSFNFPIISKLKKTKDLIINKISSFKILKLIKSKEPTSESEIKTENEKNKKLLKIIKINNINIIIPKKIIETEHILDNKIIINETFTQSKIEKNIFLNLNIFNGNNIFIEGKKKNYKIDIVYKINDIEIISKPKLKLKSFDFISISSKVNNIRIDNIKQYSEDIIKSEKNEFTQTKKDSKEKIYNIDDNKIYIEFKGLSKFDKKEILSIQNKIINFKIINEKSIKQFINISENHIINLEIKRKKKKIANLVLKKVDNFGNAFNKINIKDKINKENILTGNNNDNINLNAKIENEKELNIVNAKLNKFKTKSPNQIQIKIKNNNQNINNFNLSETNSNKTNKNNNSNEEYKNTITINNEIIYNKQSINFPVINTDILQLEEQYKKIKKELNDLYPIFSRNKQYRENFFMQLSQGNQSKYSFYLSLYKIIKDEHEEKKNNNHEKYLKMKKIMKDNYTSMHGNLRNKLKPLKKNKSSHYIFAKDKISQVYTEE